MAASKGSTADSGQDGEWARARRVLAGGVNSPLRAFRFVRVPPLFVQRAAGCHIWAVPGGAPDGTAPRRYLDWTMGFGPHLLGHAHRDVVAAVQQAAAEGLAVFGTPSQLETRVAEALRDRVRCAELLRFCASGTEATMTAVKLARAVTGRPLVVQFAGSYHGHSPWLMAVAEARRPGVDLTAVKIAAGAASGVEAVGLEFNDAAAAERLFAARGDEVACVIVEPIAGNMGGVLPRPGFLQLLRRLCTARGAVLIFDEVMTGLRCAPGSVGEALGVDPDLITLGKAVSGGLPGAALGGRRELMGRLAPEGDVYHAGTQNGNGMVMAAGLAVLRASARPGFYADLEQVARLLADGLCAAAATAGQPLSATVTGGLVGLHFASRVPETNAEVRSDKAAARARRRFTVAMLEEGIFLSPSPSSPLFVSAAHGAAAVEETLAAARRVFTKWTPQEETAGSAARPRL
eukprot:TRINITY_DN55496_c0_g1_i1.p1 TRINITY_DN55496_c0_g1~~TRINITY_DN55496_c0_g1_i1.p1  ORF type:complete len:484 (+),score=130.85 TRINITY_DN55496_c0_g1_i1:69-1454(+)